MKEKIIIFLVGLLLGSVISTGSIYIYNVAQNNSNNNQTMQMPRGPGNNGNTPPEMPNGDPNGQQNNNY